MQYQSLFRLGRGNIGLPSSVVLYSDKICSATGCNGIKDYKQSTMNNPFEEIFKRLENIEKMISPVGSSSSEEPDSRQSVLVKISVASRITGYSVNYLYHLASSGAIPYVKRGRSLRFDVNELQQWMQQQYIPASNKLSDERKKE